MLAVHTFRHVDAGIRLFSGAASLERLGPELDRLGSRRAVIICGATLGAPASPLQLVREAMGGRCAGVFAAVRAHSPLPEVEIAARELDRLGADAVVAVGGGSAIVTARGASILLAEAGDAHSLCTQRNERGELVSPKLLAPKLPQLVIPTTPTTASVKAGSALLDPVAEKRIALFDPKTRANAIFVHPELIGSASRELVVSASLNTLGMAVDGLMSLTGDSISDALLIHAARMLTRNLPLQAEHDQVAARGELVLASILTGRGTDFASAGITIALGHAISARCGLENGLANAIVMPHTLRFNATVAQGGLKKLADALGVAHESATLIESVVGGVERLFDQLRIPRRLRDVGVPRAAFPEICASVMDDWFVHGNPRRVRGAAELEQILTEAW